MLDNNQKEFLSEIITDIYKYELIFQDFKIHELSINYDDTKFIIPYSNALEEYKSTLKCITIEKVYNRLLHMIQNEAVKTLNDNINNIEKVINYSYKVIVA